MTVPAALFEMQQWMGRALKMPLTEAGRFRLPVYEEGVRREIEQRMVAGPSLNATERFGLIHQQFWFRMFVLMQERYPTLLRLFGYADFNFSIVWPYIVKYFPHHWSLQFFGTTLVQWLEEEYHEEDRAAVLVLAQVDAAYEKLQAQGIGSSLQLDADWIAFRQALLAESCAYWEEHPFPELIRTPGAIYKIETLP